MINVDKILVLTIVRHKKRQEQIAEILEGINFEFYFGFDAPEHFKNLKFVSEIPTDFFYKNSIDFHYVSKWNIGQLGAYFSIRELIKNSYENGLEKILIFEDDIVTLKSDFEKKINDALISLPSNWDLLQLGFEYDGKIYKLAYIRFLRPFVFLFNFIKKIVGFNYIRVLPKKFKFNIDYSGNSFGGHAIILSKSGMEKLLKNMDPLKEGGDILINKMITEKSLRAFSIYPILFRQADKANSSTR